VGNGGMRIEGEKKRKGGKWREGSGGFNFSTEGTGIVPTRK